MYLILFAYVQSVIVDDESKARNALKNLLSQHCQTIDVLDEG
ncbi:MAG: hypothetical protein R2764_04315 [Bacteroidales bacterium]